MIALLIKTARAAGARQVTDGRGSFMLVEAGAVPAGWRELRATDLILEGVSTNGRI